MNDEATPKRPDKVPGTDPDDLNPQAQPRLAIHLARRFDRPLRVAVRRPSPGRQRRKRWLPAGPMVGLGPAQRTLPSGLSTKETKEETE